jgi:hypothetical protein
LGVAAGGQASAAVLRETTSKTAFLAVYGNPGTNGTEVPVGGGLGRNFGFGANLLFEACEKCTTPVGKQNLSITLGTGEAAAVATANESFLGGTLLSNNTGKNNPLSFAIQFADFQDSEVTAAGKTEATQSFSDTFDRDWTMEACAPSPAEALEKCHVDPRFTVKGGGVPESTVKIENVSFVLKSTLVGTVVVQGTVWGKWLNPTKEKEAPCIALGLPTKEAGKDQTLFETQPTPGVEVSGVKGEVCLVSANNYWYKVNSTTAKEPQLELSNEG